MNHSFTTVATDRETHGEMLAVDVASERIDLAREEHGD